MLSYVPVMSFVVVSLLMLGLLRFTKMPPKM